MPSHLDSQDKSDSRVAGAQRARVVSVAYSLERQTDTMIALAFRNFRKSGGFVMIPSTIRRLMYFAAIVPVISVSTLTSVFAQSAAEDEMSLESMLDVGVSTASKYFQSSREAPASVTVVSADEIERYGYRTLADVLQNVSGFYVSYDRNYAYAGVRGFSRPSDYNNRILILIDGKSTNESVFGSSAIGTDLGMDLETLERIEIVRGPGSALYGSSAMFAVINLVPKEGRQVFGMEAVGRFGSYGQREGSLSVGHISDAGVEVMAAGTWGQVDGPDLYFPEYDDSSSNGGMAMGRDFDEYYSGWLRVRYSDLTLSLRRYSRKKGIPTAAYETAFNAASWTDDGQSMAELRFQRSLSPDLSLSARGHATRYQYEGLYPYVDEETDELYDTYDDTDALWFGLNSQLQWDSSPANRLVGGLEYSRHARVPYRIFDDFEVYSEFDKPFNTVSMFVQDEYEIAEFLNATVGLRYDRYSNSKNAFSPRAAIVLIPSESNVVKLLYGTAFRAPSAYERYYEDEWGGWKPNPGLAPERVHTLELVMERQLTERLYSSMSVYRYRVDDLVDTGIDPADSMIVFTNLGKASARGFEASLSSRWPGGASGYVSFGLQRSEDTAADVDLSNSPRHLLKTGLQVPLTGMFWGAAQVRYESARTTVYDTETDPFWSADLNLGTQPILGGLQIRFRIRNLFDNKYAFPGGYEHIQPALIQDGRTARIEVRYSF